MEMQKLEYSLWEDETLLQENLKKESLESSDDNIRLKKSSRYIEYLLTVKEHLHACDNDEFLNIRDKINIKLKEFCTQCLAKPHPENILIFFLSFNPGHMKIWSFISKFYIQQGYDCSIFLRFFESRSDFPSFSKLKILSDLLIHCRDHRELYGTYLLSLITKGEFDPHEIYKATSLLLSYGQLTDSDWLSIIDTVLVKHRGFENITEEGFVEGLNMHFTSRPVYKRFEITQIPLSGRKIQLGFEKTHAVLEYPKVSNKVRSSIIASSLSQVQLNFNTAMVILEHLGRYPQESGLRTALITLCASFVNRIDTVPSMEEIGTLIQKAHLNGNLPIATRLTDRASHLLISPTLQQYLPMISIVASAGPSGDGVNPETFDYHKGKQFPHLSLIVPELLKRGYLVEVLSWENPDIDWKSRKILFALGLWGWSGKWVELDSWLERIKSYGITLINSMDFIQWNNRKTYLKDLQEANIPVIPTLIIPSDSKDTLEEVFVAAERQFKTRDIIFKGVVGAGGAEYYHCDPRHSEAAWAILEEFKKNNCGAVVQPFWKEVYEKGELSIVLFGNFFSHTYLKLCAPNKELVQVFHGGQSFHISKEDLSLKSVEFFEKLRVFRLDLKLTLEELTSAHGNIFKLIISLKKFFHEQSVLMPPVFRLDCVIKDGQLYIMEIEGIPYPEIGLAISHDPTKKVLQWSADEIIRQLSIHMAMMRYKLP